MTIWVVDASVVLKWLLPDNQAESDTQQALQLLAGVRDGKVQLKQPVHWLAEVSTVLARKIPQTAPDYCSFLHAMELPVVNDAKTFRQAVKLSSEMNHHLFDTLYHAVALGCEHGVFVTADEKYFKKAYSQGSITLLSDVAI